MLLLCGCICSCLADCVWRCAETMRKKFSGDLVMKESFVWIDPASKSIHWAKAGTHKGLKHKHILLDKNSSYSIIGKDAPPAKEGDSSNTSNSSSSSSSSGESAVPKSYKRAAAAACAAPTREKDARRARPEAGRRARAGAA